jgi:hypothetical protein
MQAIVDVHFPGLKPRLLREALKERDPRKLIPPLHGALLKNEQDVSLFERLAFMSRRKERE